MTRALLEYRTLVFDCDGVILDSNKIKTQAFYNAAIRFGHKSATALVDYHKANGGISRYEKFQYFAKTILGIAPDATLQSELLRLFALEVRNGLMTCGIAPGIEELRRKHIQSKWMIVSGGDQNELREVFTARGLNKFFDCGIFGSPDKKEEILARELLSGNLSMPALFIGDSKYDYEAARSSGLDFVFLTEWSEVVEPEEWCSQNFVNCKANLMNLLL